MAMPYSMSRVVWVAVSILEEQPSRTHLVDQGRSMRQMDVSVPRMRLQERCPTCRQMVIRSLQ